MKICFTSTKKNFEGLCTGTKASSTKHSDTEYKETYMMMQLI